MCKTRVLGGLLAAAFLTAAAGSAMAQNPAGMAVMQNCRDDLAKYCPNSKPGDGTMRDCMKSNFRSFSATCKQTLREMMAQKQQGQ